MDAEATDSGHCKVMLRSTDYVVPVSKTGLHRAQVLHTVLQALKHANNVTVELPHGAAGGYDPYPRNQSWTEHTAASEEFAPVFFQAFGSQLLPRFGAVRIPCVTTPSLCLMHAFASHLPLRIACACPRPVIATACATSWTVSCLTPRPLVSAQVRGVE